MEKYKLSTTIDQKYAPLINRRQMLHEQTPKADFALYRERGASNIDLWCDGSIYPHHPVTNKRPQFRSVNDLLEFVGDGSSGLFGYVNSLRNYDPALEFRLQEAQREAQLLRDEKTVLMHTVNDKERLLQSTLFELQSLTQIQRENHENVEAIQQLKCEVNVLQVKNGQLIVSYESCISSLNAQMKDESDDRMQLELDLWVEIETIKESHAKALSTYTSELKRTKATLRRRDARLQNLVKTPFGYRSIMRGRKDLSTLAPKGGHTKRTLRLARSILLPATIRDIQTTNIESGSRQRLHGSRTIQTQTGKILASILSQTEVSAICEDPRLEAVGVNMTNKYLNKIGKHVLPCDILETCDRNGITHNGYEAIYKRFKGATHAAGRGLCIGCLPNPHQVSLARQMLNLKLTEYVGEYYSLNETLIVPASAKATSKEPIKVCLNEMNSLFVNIEQVQCTMVQLYGLTPSELQGKPLIFVIKLDEAEVVHGQKMERVSISVMNRALDSRINIKSKEYFSVQSEREIWPVATFQVPRETNEILSWVFNLTKIPDLIKAQGQGQLLEVPGVGSFLIEWHLAADMKTIKAMYGLKQGPNCSQCCIYCSQTRVKPIVGTVLQATTIANNRKFTWQNGLFSKAVMAEPLTGVATLGRWKPIFDIPLDRVHICVLHALNRIIEKMVHMSFMHVWTIRDKILQKSAIEEMQKVVSLTGAHGGNVIIFKDVELSGKSNNVPNKPSFSGAHALKLFQDNPIELHYPRKLYVDLINSEKNFSNMGQARRDRLDLWDILDNLLPYFKGLKLGENQCAIDFQSKVEAFGHQYIKCFGETHVTHYMHVVVRHAPFFLQRYGSLAVWSCQGMENSHHAAKTTYQRHTQHGGGKKKKSALVQTFQHWYRIIAHRFRNQEAAIMSVEELEAAICAEAKVQARREASINSSAAAYSALWRSNCIRKGSKWVPRDSIVRA